MLRKFQNSSRTRHLSHWFIKRMSHRHVDAHTCFEILKRWSDQRFQRFRHEGLDGGWNCQIADCAWLRFFWQFIWRNSEQIHYPLRPSTAVVCLERNVPHHRSVMDGDFANFIIGEDSRDGNQRKIAGQYSRWSADGRNCHELPEARASWAEVKQLF